MMTVVTFTIFAGAFAAAAYAVVATIAPALPRMRQALLGQPRAFLPLAQLARAERRIAVRPAAYRSAAGWREAA